jgi:hypothetical protein
MSNEVNYLDLIRKLEDEKWNYIKVHGQAGVKFWPPIDAKLDKLYKWYTKAYMEGKVTIQQHSRVIKAK